MVADYFHINALIGCYSECFTVDRGTSHPCAYSFDSKQYFSLHLFIRVQKFLDWLHFTYAVKD